MGMYEELYNLYRQVISEKKITRNGMKIIKDTTAVSPVVATLMLIMVVAGSVTFLSGMMQNMNSQTDKVAGKSNSADRTSININIISSDLAEPAIEPLVNAYNDKSLGVFLQLQKSETLNVTSNVSIGEVSTGIADIGVSDRLPSQDELDEHPDLVAQKFGFSGIVVIVNKGAPCAPVCIFSKSALQGFYNGSDTSYTAYQMANPSGTQQAFMQYLNISINSNLPAVTGSAGMLNAVENNPSGIGFIEYGFVANSESVSIAGLYNESNGKNYTNMTYSNFTAAVASDDMNNSYYPLELVHPLYFVTRGNPTLENSFIKWARSSEGQDIIEKNGYMSYMREFN